MLGGASSSNSATEWWGGLPMGTRLVFGLNALVYVAGLCVPKNWAFSAARAPASFCMYPRMIWAHPDQWYRIFTSAFVHGGLMHIGFNMVSERGGCVLPGVAVSGARLVVFPLLRMLRAPCCSQLNFIVSGPNLERRIGTLRLLNLVAALVAVLGVLYMMIALGGVMTTYPRFWNECAVGFSGVIFALITAESLTVRNTALVAGVPPCGSVRVLCRGTLSNASALSGERDLTCRCLSPSRPRQAYSTTCGASASARGGTLGRCLCSASSSCPMCPS